MDEPTYEVVRNGVVIGKVGKGTFYFDASGYDLRAEYQIRAVDGDGNGSAPATAASIATGDRATQASAGFGSTQGLNHWSYQEIDGNGYSDMVYDSAEGLWKGTSAYSMIADGWMHPGAAADSARTYTAPLSGRIFVESKATIGSQGDGVNVKILKNDVQVWPASVGRTF